MNKAVAKNISVFLWTLKCFLAEAQLAVSQNAGNVTGATLGLHSENRCWVGLDWHPYKDEKCLKVFDKSSPVHQMSYEDAKTYCKKQYDANLVTIPDKEKQAFLETYLKFKKIDNNVWIGLEYNDKKKVYEWAGGAKYEHKNWAAGSPKNKSGFCVQMLSDTSKYGNWSDEICTKKNFILCEKIQEWPMSRLHEKVISLTKKLNDYMEKFYPIGLTYVQLPKEKSPKELWPWTSWKDVSSEYSDVFFRVYGGNSGSWGVVQGESVPEVTKVRAGTRGENQYSFHKGAWSQYVYAGRKGYWLKVNSYHAVSFYRSSAEVRPRNMAIRIWRRTL